MNCPNCRKSFPEHLLSEMCINGDYRLLCPVCALMIRNELHGLPPETQFNGPIASQMHKDALEWLAKSGQGGIA